VERDEYEKRLAGWKGIKMKRVWPAAPKELGVGADYFAAPGYLVKW
jgi:hypothetical protein